MEIDGLLEEIAINGAIFEIVLTGATAAVDVAMRDPELTDGVRLAFEQYLESVNNLVEYVDTICPRICAELL